MKKKCKLCVNPKVYMNEHGKILISNIRKCSKTECMTVVNRYKPKRESFIMQKKEIGVEQI